jgi:hypothetical protein
MFRIAAIAVAAMLAGCAGTMDRVPAVERMYVIDCGENRVKDLARWSTADAGKGAVFLNHCYLIKHAKGWLLWDTGISDTVAAMPNGMTVLGGVLTQVLRKPLAESLREIGIAPGGVQHLAMSMRTSSPPRRFTCRRWSTTPRSGPSRRSSASRPRITPSCATAAWSSLPATTTCSATARW